MSDRKSSSPPRHSVPSGGPGKKPSNSNLPRHSAQGRSDKKNLSSSSSHHGVPQSGGSSERRSTPSPHRHAAQSGGTEERRPSSSLSRRSVPPGSGSSEKRSTPSPHRHAAQSSGTGERRPSSNASSTCRSAPSGGGSSEKRSAPSPHRHAAQSSGAGERRPSSSSPRQSVPGGEASGKDLSFRAKNEEACQNRTQPLYRSSKGTKAKDYFDLGGLKDIITDASGDFNKAGEDAAYFATDPRYAEKLAKKEKMVIKQTVPQTWLRSGDAVVYDEQPNDDWRQRVHADRRSEPLAGPSRKTQKADITIGPIADTHTSHFTKNDKVPSSEVFKPAKDPEGNYYQQVAVKGEKLKEIGKYPREVYNPRHTSEAKRNASEKGGI
ncbi:hypothetical protein SBOR_2740 [Sclerotinia borealis F-4128]|uniref:Uncharacterized protein n=1 Tax=Sclerotinia borealis (strain F-4128) TaxID=1432307 RepID=W9CQY0_SCLBF|nr:hypothetical protein SBOR_2740 [Sclerotinia borealis F-4128]